MKVHYLGPGKSWNYGVFWCWKVPENSSEIYSGQAAGLLLQPEYLASGQDVALVENSMKRSNIVSKDLAH